MPKKIVLATIGSLGDLHPFIAVGLALKARGLHPLLAVPKSNVEKVERAGLEAHAIFPSFEEIGAMLGISEEAATTRMLRDPDYLIRRLMVHYLPDSARTLHALCEDTACIASSIFAIAGPIVAEARGIPLVPMILQPMTMMSALDPPQTPDFWMLARPPITPMKLRWNRMELAVIRLELRRRYARRINAVRRDYGLGPAPFAPVFQTPPGAKLVLGLYSEALGPIQPDYPPNTKLTGFPVFDSDSGAPEQLDPELDAFLSAGEPPIVFTLGSFAVYAPGNFYQTSITATRALGRRALLLTGPGAMTSAPHAMVRSYAPHSLVFPRAAAIVHHGGIGTTGAAMRAGRPQLVVPHMGDQPDQGARIKRLGLGDMIPAKHYTPARATDALRRMLADPAIAAKAKEIAPRVAAENGAETAAEAIAVLVA